LPTFALDTATPSPSLALVSGDDPVAELWLAPTPDGGRRVLQAAHGLLAATGTGTGDIEDVVVGVGPGGFTGLRIGIATALGLGQALGVPVSGASSLEAMALGILAERGPDALAVPVIDARRGEVFAGAYRGDEGGPREVLAPAAWRPEALAAELALLAEDGGPALLAGDGLDAAGDLLAGPALEPLPRRSPAHRLRAAALVELVRAGAGRPATPTYLRLPDAEVNRRRRAAEAAR
jgi:tRNA threonylcarbamoyladenosine biosynthesis protein TsaB